ncbi:hypothetical protein [uncultured Brevundimonas sp.]|uniref:glycine zipper 2TM domain-containing protein n=1 Tax=uncultured Brevundimonas sp. TaxID=213418 RepID=UPI00260D3AD4|nr:hypothetical protein [uncultured Brevundimonas sp.]
MIAKITKSAAIALAGIACAATALPAVATAQSYGGGYAGTPATYDPCLRETRERQTTGGLVGAAIGALAGSQIAHSGRRSEGAVLGGVLGAAVGAGVGGSAAACTPGSAPMPVEVYEAPPPPPPPPPPHRRYDDGRPSKRGGYDYYRDYPESYEQGRPQPAPARDECQLAESEIRLPDGRVETRYVRTCPDERGRYRVVD